MRGEEGEIVKNSFDNMQEQEQEQEDNEKEVEIIFILT